MYHVCLHLTEIACNVLSSRFADLAYELQLTSDEVLFYVTDTHPLMWWNDNGAKYPRHVHLAVKYTGIPTT